MNATTRRSEASAQQQDDHAGPPAPSPVAPSLTLSDDDAAFLAARLRRLFSHFGYSLPAFAAEDASLIRIAGSCIGAVLSQIAAPSEPVAKWTDYAELIAAVEETVGMGHGAWDCVPPEELVAAVIKHAPAPSALPLFAGGVAQRKWESLQADGYRMQRIEFARSINGQETRGIIDPWGRVLWKYGQDDHAGSPAPIVLPFKAEHLDAVKLREALARLDTPAHAGSPAPSEPVATLHDDGHYTFKPGKEPWGARQAGWRMDVYAPSAQSSKAALSDEDVRELRAEHGWAKETIRAVEAAIMFRAGTARKPLDQALDLLDVMFAAYENGPACYEDPEEQAGYCGQGVKLDDETFHCIADLLNKHRPRGITPQAGEESGE